MKKKIMGLGMLLMAVVLTTGSVSGTYARYTSDAVGETDKAYVAKWDFKIGEKNGVGTRITDDTASWDFELFDNVYELTDDATVSNIIESHVDGNGTVVVAPGTGGTKYWKLVNDSDVDVIVTVDIKTTDSTGIAPLEFSGWNVDNDSLWFDTDTINSTTNEMTFEMKAHSENYVEVFWRWKFNADGSADNSDTALGVAAADGNASSVKLSATITATQKD